MYINIYIHIYLYIYTYIYRERERERETGAGAVRSHACEASRFSRKHTLLAPPSAEGKAPSRRVSTSSSSCAVPPATCKGKGSYSS